jgi:DNA-binding transcriptional MocR family regulator
VRDQRNVLELRSSGRAERWKPWEKFRLFPPPYKAFSVMLHNVLTDELWQRLAEPTSRGLADAVTAAIRDGVLKEDTKLPPIRAVAEALQLSPTTVSAAWALLARAGTIATNGRRGTVVIPPNPDGPRRYRRALERNQAFTLDLSTGVPDIALLPDLKAALRSVPTRRTPNTYLDDAVLPELLEVLRNDWPYPAEHISVVDGAMDAQDQVVTRLLRNADRVAVEHPCFPPLLDLLESNNIRLVGVAVDEEGMDPDELAVAVKSGVRAVFLQPRAHNPTGASFTARRVRQLAGVLSGSDVIVVEDDSAGAISSAPDLSVGTHLPNQVIHIRSFSKSHGPDLRLAALSGPAALIDPITERRLLGQGWTSRLLQSVLLDLLTRPASIEQVAHARAVYAHRRALLVDSLATHGITVGGNDGINIWLPVRDEAAAQIRLASRGIGVAAGGPFAANRDVEPHLRVTAGLIVGDHEEIAAELAAAAAAGGWAGPR